MSGHRSASDLTKARALELLCEGKPVGQLAAEVSVHRSSVWRWMRDADFRTRYRAALEERVRDGALRLDAAATAALELLEDVCQDEAAPLPIRVRAADSLLRHAGEARANIVRALGNQAGPENLPLRPLFEDALRNALRTTEGRELASRVMGETAETPATLATLEECRR
ncbi:MAG TPA: helix-turn-helix domain-containing protein [Polyangiaceae bacterium]|nr:helix-turn-helix domain-containing protein [Polyangiaceae bacterium]